MGHYDSSLTGLMARRLLLQKNLSELEDSYKNRPKGSIYYTRRASIMESLDYNYRRAQEIGVKGNIIILEGLWHHEFEDISQKEPGRILYLNMSVEEVEQLVRWKYPNFELLKITNFSSLGVIIRYQEFRELLG